MALIPLGKDWEEISLTADGFSAQCVSHDPAEIKKANNIPLAEDTGNKIFDGDVADQDNIKSVGTKVYGRAFGGQDRAVMVEVN